VPEYRPAHPSLLDREYRREKFYVHAVATEITPSSREPNHRIMTREHRDSFRARGFLLSLNGK
jgi:hypothetical protein